MAGINLSALRSSGVADTLALVGQTAETLMRAKGQQDDTKLRGLQIQLEMLRSKRSQENFERGLAAEDARLEKRLRSSKDLQAASITAEKERAENARKARVKQSTLDHSRAIGLEKLRRNAADRGRDKQFANELKLMEERHRRTDSEQIEADIIAGVESYAFGLEQAEDGAFKAQTGMTAAYNDADMGAFGLYNRIFGADGQFKAGGVETVLGSKRVKKIFESAKGRDGFYEQFKNAITSAHGNMDEVATVGSFDDLLKYWEPGKMKDLLEKNPALRSQMNGMWTGLDLSGEAKQFATAHYQMRAANLHYIDATAQRSRELGTINEFRGRTDLRSPKYAADWGKFIEGRSEVPDRFAGDRTNAGIAKVLGQEPPGVQPENPLYQTRAQTQLRAEEAGQQARFQAGAQAIMQMDDGPERVKAEEALQVSVNQYEWGLAERRNKLAEAQEQLTGFLRDSYYSGYLQGGFAGPPQQTARQAIRENIGGLAPKGRRLLVAPGAAADIMGLASNMGIRDPDYLQALEQELKTISKIGTARGARLGVQF